MGKKLFYYLGITSPPVSNYEKIISAIGGFIGIFCFLIALRIDSILLPLPEIRIPKCSNNCILLLMKIKHWIVSEPKLKENLSYQGILDNYGNSIKDYDIRRRICSLLWYIYSGWSLIMQVFSINRT